MQSGKVLEPLSRGNAERGIKQFIHSNNGKFMKEFRKTKAYENFSDVKSIALKKVLRMVRFTVFCFFLGLIQVMAVDSYSQQNQAVPELSK
jgi:hypothetical protein